MKPLIRSIVTVAALTAPVIALAQPSTGPVTRAQVRADLVQMERAGYNPARRDDAIYPADIPVTEARVAAKSVAMPMSDTGMGTEPSSASESGTRNPTGPSRSNLFAHH